MDAVVGEELYGVVCRMGSGIVVLKYSAIQRLMREIQSCVCVCVCACVCVCVCVYMQIKHIVNQSADKFNQTANQWMLCK